MSSRTCYRRSQSGHHSHHFILSLCFPSSDPGWDCRARDQNLPAARCRLRRGRGVQRADQGPEGETQLMQKHTANIFSILFSIPPPKSVFHMFLFQASIPFAVIGSNQLIEVKGKKIRGRLYPWGVVEVENPEHNDFLKLRTMLV